MQASGPVVDFHVDGPHAVQEPGEPVSPGPQGSCDVDGDDVDGDGGDGDGGSSGCDGLLSSQNLWPPR